MNGLIAFSKKEITENIRNYRFFIMLAIFCIFGVMNPFIAKFTPELMESFAPNLAEIIETPNALDSWGQFYKNTSQLGLSLTIILFSSWLSGEYAKGTLTIMLTKGLSRFAVILSKFLVAVMIFTLSYWVCFSITYGYTAYFWPKTMPPHTFFAAFALWVSGVMHLSILMLGSVLFRQAFTSILFLLGVTVGIGLLGQAELTAAYSPSFLVSKNIDLLSGDAAISGFIMPMIVAVVLSILLLIISVIVFNRKKL